MFHRCLVLAILFYTFLISISYAAQELSINAQGNIKAVISTKGVNHISISNDRITEVIGNDDQYQIEGDNDTGHIFLTPKAKKDEVIHVTISTEKGVIQNFNLKVDDNIAPQTIVLKGPQNKEEGYSRNSNTTKPISNSYYSNSKDDAINVLKAVITKQGTLPFTKLDLNSLSCLQKHNLKPVTGIKYSNTSFNIYEIIGKETITNNEKQFKGCIPQLIAVSIQGNKLYLVQENGR